MVPELFDVFSEFSIAFVWVQEGGKEKPVEKCDIAFILSGWMLMHSALSTGIRCSFPFPPIPLEIYKNFCF